MEWIVLPRREVVHLVGLLVCFWEGRNVGRVHDDGGVVTLVDQMASTEARAVLLRLALALDLFILFEFGTVNRRKEKAEREEDEDGRDDIKGT